MNSQLNSRNILILSNNRGTEEPEIQRPLTELREAGATVTVAAPSAGVVQTLQGDWDLGAEVPVDTTVDAVDAADFDAVVLPGGTLNADNLRLDETVQALVRSFSSAGKPVAAVCHAPWILIDSGLVDGQKLTSYASLRPDLTNAGATWVDQEVVVDDSKGFRLITSRDPGDLDAFIAAIIDALS